MCGYECVLGDGPYPCLYKLFPVRAYTIRAYTIRAYTIRAYTSFSLYLTVYIACFTVLPP